MGNLETMRAYLGHIAANDWEGAKAFFADDIVAHVSGHHAFSGTYRGADAFMGYLRDATGAADSVEIAPHDLLANEEHAVVLATITSVHGGQTLVSHRVVVYHVADGKITELWIIDEDQKAMEDFMA